MWLLIVKVVFYVAVGAMIWFSWRIVKRDYKATPPKDVIYERLVTRRQEIHSEYDELEEAQLHQEWLKEVKATKPEKRPFKVIK